MNIEFELLRPENLRLVIYNANGKVVRVVADAHHESGSYRDKWELVDELSNPVPNGVYFVRLMGESFVSTKSVVVNRR